MDFEVDSGEIVGIIGPNGAGKTTFVNLLTGVLDATSGEIVFDGKSLQGSPVHDRARAGLVRSFQIPRVQTTSRSSRTSARRSSPGSARTIPVYRPRLGGRHPRRSGRSARGVRPRGEARDGGRSDPARRQEDPRRLYERRDAAETAILDEPTSGVATENKYAIMDRLQNYFETSDSAVLFIEHDMELVADYAERVVAMDQGGSSSTGRPRKCSRIRRSNSASEVRSDVARTRRRRRLDRGHHRPPGHRPRGRRERDRRHHRSERGRQDLDVPVCHGTPDRPTGVRVVPRRGHHEHADPRAQASRNRVRARGPPAHLEADVSREHRDGAVGR